MGLPVCHVLTSPGKAVFKKIMLIKTAIEPPRGRPFVEQHLSLYFWGRGVFPSLFVIL
jgi:hypothetical protein